jgi:organic radical activating enzyme
MQKLPVVEIFNSFQGEGYYMFTPMTFIRLFGCNQNCNFCDTELESSTDTTISEILDNISIKDRNRVCITGGEPCIHEHLPLLIHELRHTLRKHIHLETNGSLRFTENVWLTVSPKELQVDFSIPKKAREWKVIIPHCERWVIPIENTGCRHIYVQPADPGGKGSYLTRIKPNLQKCKPYLERGWKLSLQWHKVFNWR